jgi:hypothetical protein
MCECCGRPATKWYLVDDNAECQLCAKCARDLRAECDVKPIPTN